MSNNWLITGGTGFLGRYVVDAISFESRTVLSRKPISGIPTELGDLSSERIQLKGSYSHVVHLAGLAHSIPRTEEEKSAFFQINYEGTRRLLKALENTGCFPQSFIYASSVAVYGIEEGSAIDESTPRNPTDPYGQSKCAAEDEISEWCQKRNVRCVILRPPLIAGTNPPGNLGAMINAIKRGRYLSIGKGMSRRSVVRAADIAAALPRIAETSGVYNLTDGQHPSFAELEEVICQRLNRPLPKSLPLPIAKLGAECGDLYQAITKKSFPLNSRVLSKITSTLTFSDAKARREFSWNPDRVINHPEELA